MWISLALRYWREIGVAAAVALAGLLAQARLEISGLHGQLKAIADAPAPVQTQTGSVSGTASVKVVYKPVPCPPAAKDAAGACPPCNCPELTLDATASSIASLDQTQTQPKQPQPVLTNSRQRGIVVSLGAGTYGPLKAVPYVGIQNPIAISNWTLSSDVRLFYPTGLWQAAVVDPSITAGLSWEFK